LEAALKIFFILRVSLIVLSMFCVAARPADEVPAKTVVLTFDDAVKTQLTNVAPLLKELGLHATFFISQRWMDDKTNFMTWEDVAKLHAMGFEIGNHSWTHSDFSKADGGVKLDAELEMVEKELARVGVPKPVSFAWCGNSFGPEALEALQSRGYRVARRGMQPEIPYGEVKTGPALDVRKHYPLLVPTTGDAYPGWTLDHFKEVLASAKPGEIVVFQFHGVPDVAHPWVNTPLENFRQYMTYLKQGGYRTITMSDLLQYYDASKLPDDPLVKTRYPAK
jgi:peptidoglycan/xylan/chitin deacetylase (PgdA/CDA1 family)